MLRIEVLSSSSLQRGEVIMINSMGLFGSHIPEREKMKPGSGYDGFTYFGTIPHIYGQEADGVAEVFNGGDKIVVNDFLIQSKGQDQVNLHMGRHFHIWFDCFNSAYFIRDLGIGFGIFQKIGIEPVVLKSNMLINIGEAYFVVSIHGDDGEHS